MLRKKKGRLELKYDALTVNNALTIKTIYLFSFSKIPLIVLNCFNTCFTPSETCSIKRYRGLGVYKKI